MKTLRPDVPPRDVTEVGPGDYIQLVDGTWLPIETNSAHGQALPRDWEIVTGPSRLPAKYRTYGMYNIRRYAKAEDLE